MISSFFHSIFTIKSLCFNFSRIYIALRGFFQTNSSLLMPQMFRYITNYWIYCGTKKIWDLIHRYFFFFKIYFTLKSELQKEMERQKKRDMGKDLSAADSLPKWPQQPGLRQSKARSQHLLLDLPTGHRGRRPWAILHCFPSHWQGAGFEVELLEWELAPIWDASTQGGGSDNYAIVQAPMHNFSIGTWNHVVNTYHNKFVKSQRTHNTKSELWGFW